MSMAIAFMRSTSKISQVLGADKTRVFESRSDKVPNGVGSHGNLARLPLWMILPATECKSDSILPSIHWRAMSSESISLPRKSLFRSG